MTKELESKQYEGGLQELGMSSQMKKMDCHDSSVPIFE